MNLVVRHGDSWAMKGLGSRVKALGAQTLAWDLDKRRMLAEFLEIAAMHGRTVILTSTGGHMFTPMPSVPAQRRWRTTRPHTLSWEVRVAGPRVRTPTGHAFLTWETFEDRVPRRFNSGTSPGGVGGGSLAEVAVPILVFQSRDGTAPKGWEPAGNQEPSWWAPDNPQN